MKTKKIAIIYSGAKHWGGVETYLKQLFELADKKKIELTLVSLGQWELDKYLKDNKHSVKNFDLKWSQLLGYTKISEYLTDNNFDLVVSQNMVANFYARLSSHKAKIPSLVTIHSDYRFDYQGYKKYIYFFTFKILERYTTSYITVSHFLERGLMEMGVDRNKIKVIYNGVVDKGPQTKIFGNEVIFGSLGRLHHKKGYHNLVKAASLIKANNFKVFIWGEGEERPVLERLINDYKLGDKVFLMGFTKDIEKALKETDIYIQPSLEEGFGLTVADAMLAEKPIIVTPAGSLPELIVDKKSGLVASDVNPDSLASAMQYAMDNKDKLVTISKQSRNEALKRFSVDTWVSNIENEYMRVAK